MNRGLSRSDVHVWYWLTPRFDDGRLSRLEGLLSRDELARARGMRSAHDRRDFVAAHALLRLTLSRYDDRQPHEWMLQYGRHGKPALVDAHGVDLVFNLSHARGLVACAIARDTMVGIDVEPVNRSADMQRISSRYFSESEQRMLAACPPELRCERFVELWTLKEALLKAIGTGIGMSGSLGAWSFQFVDQSDIRLSVPGGGADWQCALSAPTTGYRLALAVRCGPGQPPYRIEIGTLEQGQPTVVG